MRLCLAVLGLACAVLAELTPEDERLLRCAQGDAGCAALLNEEPPATFQTLITTHAGGRFVVHTVSAWSPPHAKRFYALVRLSYFTGAFAAVSACCSSLARRARRLSKHVWLGLNSAHARLRRPLLSRFERRERPVSWWRLRGAVWI